MGYTDYQVLTNVRNSESGALWKPSAICRA